jgi:primosomal protein N' (replication factor Y)
MDESNDSRAPAESKAQVASRAPAESKAQVASRAPAESKAQVASRAPAESGAQGASRVPAETAAPLYAEVAVARPVRQTYTYQVPDGLRRLVRPGCMVRVPILNQKAEGVVVSLSSVTSLPLKKIKFLESVLTPEYAIPPDLMDLGAWMTEYYLGGPGETLSAVSFFGLREQKRVTERRLVLNDPSLWSGETTRSESPAAPASARASENSAAALAPSPTAALAPSPAAHTAPPAAPPAAAHAAPPVLTARQREIVAFFQENLNEAITRSELMRRVKCSREVIAALLRKGVLAEQTTELDRPDGYRQQAAAGQPHVLLPEQDEAFSLVSGAIREDRFEAFLLYGITGSGKTEVYLQAIALVLEKGRQAIVLVPEISLTPQAVARFRSRFGPQVGVYHSHLTPGQKYDLWRRIESGAVQILIGARSAIFAPFPRLGLIVVDEEHEHSYKQSDPAPRYHARDVAVWRARQLGIPVILGSATPSLESMRNAEVGKFRMLRLTRRTGEARLPTIRLIDMAEHVRREGSAGLISKMLREAVQERLNRREQVILFLNRRGFSNFFFCMVCKTPIRCDHCDVVMTWHKAAGKLLCHYCGDEKPRPTQCPACQAPDPAPLGAGTQRIEEEMAALFPEARILRVDFDTAGGKHGFLGIWDQIERGDYDILLGTQMISKGLHLEHVTLVGVISADHSLFLPDFRSAERTFDQLTQVAGRAGRMQRAGEVILQTFIPHHYAIQRAVAHDAEGFYKQELHMREMLHFPPFHRLLLARFSGVDAARVRERAGRLAALLRDKAVRRNTWRGVSVYGPVPCPIARIKDHTRWQVLLRGQTPSLMRGLLMAALEEYEKDKKRAGVTVTLDMDPMDLL